MDAANPLFIGGTGRSGTSVLGRVLGAHSQYQMIRTELVFPTADGGLPDLLEGRTDLDAFLGRMRDRWWRSERPGSAKRTDRGLNHLLSRKQFNAALAAMEKRFADDPVAASRRLVDSIVAPVLKRSGKPSWIDATPYNAFQPETLLKLYPDMRLIHIVRDGRDVACSVADTYFGPDDPVLALEWWDERLRRAERGAAGIPPDRLLVVSFDELVKYDRKATFERMLEFIGVKRERALRLYFEEHMTAAGANLGRWRSLSREESKHLDAAYTSRLLRYAAEGIGCAEPLLKRTPVDTVDPMSYRVNVVFSGPNADHTVRSPIMSREEALAELRALRRLRDSGQEIYRSWISIPAGSIAGISLAEDGD